MCARRRTHLPDVGSALVSLPVVMLVVGLVVGLAAGLMIGAASDYARDAWYTLRAWLEAIAIAGFWILVAGAIVAWLAHTYWHLF